MDRTCRFWIHRPDGLPVILKLAASHRKAYFISRLCFPISLNAASDFLQVGINVSALPPCHSLYAHFSYVSASISTLIARPFRARTFFFFLSSFCIFSMFPTRHLAYVRDLVIFFFFSELIFNQIQIRGERTQEYWQLILFSFMLCFIMLVERGW